MRFAVSVLAVLWFFGSACAEESDKEAASADLEAALKKLQLPGVKIHPAERFIDVAAEVCLDEGMLELVACTKGSKEHESIVTVTARPMHIHTALLLLNAEPGNPAMWKADNDEGKGLVHIPPRGAPIELSLVWSEEGGKKIERPIADFIKHARSQESEEDGSEENRFPTNTFLFAGSQLVKVGDGPRAYVCERSGNVISIATFGDELLCLPEVHSHQNGALVWQVDKTHLPEVGAKVTLRLRLRLRQAPRQKKAE